MAKRRVTDIRVEGLDELVLRASSQSREMRNSVRRALRKIARPLVADAKERFQALPGTGPKVAETVRLRFVGSDVVMSFGGPSAPFAAGREFGARRDWTRRHVARVNGKPTVVARKVGYSSNPNIFNRWTGNRFDLGDTGERLTIRDVAGRAFYPAMAAGAIRTEREFQTFVDGQLSSLREA